MYYKNDVGYTEKLGKLYKKIRKTINCVEVFNIFLNKQMDVVS